MIVQECATLEGPSHYSTWVCYTGASGPYTVFEILFESMQSFIQSMKDIYTPYGRLLQSMKPHQQFYYT